MNPVKQYLGQAWTNDGKLSIRFTHYSETDMKPPGLITATPIENGYCLDALLPPPGTVFHYVALVARRKTPVINQLEGLVKALKADAIKAEQARAAQASADGTSAASSFFDKRPPGPSPEDPPSPPVGNK
jgi:hypothetical protein